jgi:hypothetical protein
LSGRTKLFIIFPLLILVIGFTSNAYGQIVNPITVTTDKSLYYEDETIVISGEVSEILYGYAVSLLIIDPNGDAILIDQLIVDRNKKFQTEITAGGQMNEIGSGMYTVSVLYATENRTAETTFQYVSSGTSTQPSITISTDKTVYKENEKIHVKYVIAKRIPNEKLTITLYNPSDLFVVSIGIPDSYLSSRLSSTTTIPFNYEFAFGGVYSIIAEYGSSKSIQSVEIFTSEPNIPPTGTITLPDNDNDGVPDSKDKCVFYKEEYNGYLDDDGCPDYPRIQPPFKKELLNGDEYVPVVYSIDFTKRPLIGISFGENKHELFQKVIPSIKNGVEMWTTPLEQKYGGDWSVDFVVITPQNQLQVKPDIIFNIDTLESNEKCSEFRGWAHQPKDYDYKYKIWKAKIPINIHHCFKLDYLEDRKKFELLSTTSYELTNAHEFFHALGFYHVCNKKFDLMIGTLCPQITSGGHTPEEYKKSFQIISDFDLTAIAYLYGVDGFQNPNKPVFSNSNFTANDYLNFDASTYTITPVTSPEPEMEKTMEPKILRPLQQIALGISPQDVTCKDDFQKLYKSNGNPICVSKSSAEKLITRGFTT